MLETTPATVFFYALLTALATGLGALPLLLVRRVPLRWVGLASAVAGGLMAAASLTLVWEGARESILRTAVGVLAGLAFIALSRRALRGRDVHWGELDGADAVKVLLIVATMTVHSMAEGVGVGVSFGGGQTLGVYITAAIAVHNIPEGLAISLVMVPRGTPVWKAALWSIVSSLPQPLLALPAFLLVEVFRPALPVGLGFAAGAMGWMIVSELLPEARREASRAQVTAALLISALLMLAVQAML
ncbi:MAG TPA: ZIP family metal transporter [Longimicrobiales bacterium]|nr:ZIP family metal transporter [Longimicrobiales bacterium]